MAEKVATFLMFEGGAREALALYREAFLEAVQGVVNDHPDGPGKGKILRAELSINGHDIILFDSPSPHAFTFTPSVSLFVECDGEEKLDRRFALLSEGGQVMMPPGNYGFSRKFAWVSDRFGVSWQLNLA